MEDIAGFIILLQVAGHQRDAFAGCERQYVTRIDPVRDAIADHPTVGMRIERDVFGVFMQASRRGGYVVRI